MHDNVSVVELVMYVQQYTMGWERNVLIQQAQLFSISGAYSSSGLIFEQLRGKRTAGNIKESWGRLGRLDPIGLPNLVPPLCLHVLQFSLRS